MERDEQSSGLIGRALTPTRIVVSSLFFSTAYFLIQITRPSFTPLPYGHPVKVVAGWWVAFISVYFVLLVASFLWSAAVGKWNMLLAHVVGLGMLPLAIYSSLLVSGNKFTFPGAMHDKIAELYKTKLSGNSLHLEEKRKLHLISLGDECDPRIGCSCWILVDPEDTASILKDSTMGWHVPISPLFYESELPKNFGAINMRRIDKATYSVIGCDK